MATPTAIKASGLAKRYGDLVAVDDISFDVEKGEFFGFLGPNGAGKTTTIRMLTGLSKPTAGKVELLGLDVGSNATRAKGFTGVVPEVSNLYDELTALENLPLWATSRVASTRDMAVRALLELFLPQERDVHWTPLSRSSYHRRSPHSQPKGIVPG